MLSEKSMEFLKQLGWTKKREIDLEKTYPVFFREQAYLNKKKFAAIRPKLANYCGLSLDTDKHSLGECTFSLYPFSIFGLDNIKELGEFLGFEVIFIGELAECVPMLMSFDGRVFVYYDSSIDEYKELLEFENIETFINAIIKNRLHNEARIVSASGFKWKRRDSSQAGWGYHKRS